MEDRAAEPLFRTHRAGDVAIHLQAAGWGWRVSGGKESARFCGGNGEICLRRSPWRGIAFRMFFLALLLAVLLAYLLGSIPAGYIAGQLHGVDLRKAGSGNIGATNALRVLGKKTGYAVFAFDFLKGFAAVKLAMAIGTFLVFGHETLFGIAGAIAVVLGHLFPVWLRFQGGKGIATSGAVMLALFPWPVFAVGLFLWVVLFFTTRYVSVASLAATVSLPVTSLVLALAGHCDWLLVVAGALMAALATWKHRPNIRRLMEGTEKKFERKREAA